MIELTVKEFMEGQLSVPLYMEFPEDAPGTFVVLRKGDTSREDYLDSAMLVVDSYAPTLLEAAQLNEQVKTVLDALISLGVVSSSRRGGDYPLMDTKNKRYRYQAVQTITHY